MDLHPINPLLITTVSENEFNSHHSNIRYLNDAELEDRWIIILQWDESLPYLKIQNIQKLSCPQGCYQRIMCHWGKCTTGRAFTALLSFLKIQDLEVCSVSCILSMCWSKSFMNLFNSLFTAAKHQPRHPSGVYY